MTCATSPKNPAQFLQNTSIFCAFWQLFRPFLKTIFIIANFKNSFFHRKNLPISRFQPKPQNANRYHRGNDIFPNL
jgi:hypothetical protein